MNNHNRGIGHLSQDIILKAVIARVKLAPLSVRSNHFESLIVSIINQQLSTKAAATIVKRFVQVYKGKFPTPKQILKIRDLQLRNVGLSYQKVAYIKNIARAVENKELDFATLVQKQDEEIIEELVKIKGIGRWTAEMFLLFSLARPSVFSYGDLGLKNAIRNLYQIDHKRHVRKYQKLIESWHPYQSLASRYLWKSLDLKG